MSLPSVNASHIPAKTNNNKGKQKVSISWVPKKDKKAFIVHIALKAHNTSRWYFDSGCSRHMKGDASFFTSLEDYQDGRVTFGDGSKSSIIGRGTIELPGFPKLENVFYVKGLKANLLSISQLCDTDFAVKFDRDTCKVYN